MKELNVKVGDEVLCICWELSRKTERIAKVIRVTPKGRIRIDCMDGQFDKYGRLMGNSGMFSSCSIRRLTEEDRERLTKAETIRRALKMLENSKLTYEQAVKIIEILEDDKDDNN